LKERLVAIKQFIKENIFLIAAVAAAVAIVAALNVLYPYSGDDWYWGTKPFSWQSIIEVNGRYLGSVLSLIITRIKWLRVVICTVVSVAIIYVMSLNGDRHKVFFFIIAAGFFVAMPIETLKESLVWASGFANYAPSALAVVAYVTLVRGEFSDEAPVYGKAVPYLAAALGVVGALFVETVTLGNLIVGAAVLIYHFIRFKKPSATLIAFLGGAIVGAILMFINPAVGAEGYRGIDYRISYIINRYMGSFHYWFAYYNFVINAILVCLMIWRAVKKLASLKPLAKIVVIACFAVQIVYLIISGFDYFGSAVMDKIPHIWGIRGLLTLCFFASLIAEAVFLSDGINERLNFIFILGSILAYTLALLVVNPIGPRNFICPYLLYAVFAITLLNGNIKDSGLSERKLVLSLGAVALAGAVVGSAVYIAIYAKISACCAARDKSIAEQLAAGNTTIVVDIIPDDIYIGDNKVEFVHNADPDNTYFSELFKYYYNIDQSTNISVGDFIG